MVYEYTVTVAVHKFQRLLLFSEVFYDILVLKMDNK